MERVANPRRYTRREAVGGVLLGGFAFLSQSESVHPAPSPEIYDACITGPDEATTEVLEEIYENADVQDGPIDRYEIAEQYGLSLIPQEILHNFTTNELLYADDPVEIIDKLNALTEQWLGFRVSINMQATDEGAKLMFENIEDMRTTLSVITDTISLLPREFYESVQFTELAVEDIPDSIGGDYTLSSGRIRIDPENIPSPTLILHELGHAVNMTFCGNSEDAAFTDTLPPDVEYGDGAEDVEWHGTFVSPYGMQNDREDSAMVFAAWMTGQMGLSGEYYGTPLYEKLAIIMYRMDRLVPGIVEYVERFVRPYLLEERKRR